jgi:hypothetical protein
VKGEDGYYFLVEGIQKIGHIYGEVIGDVLLIFNYASQRDVERKC